MSSLTLFLELGRRRVFRALAWYGAAAWLAVQVLALVREPLGLSLLAFRAAIAAAIVGLPVVALLAWAFDSSAPGPDGRPGASAAPTRTVPPWPAPSAWLALAAGVTLAVGAYNAWQLRVAGDDSERVAIAVLPLANLGTLEDQALVLGLHDALIGELGTNPNLTVTTRTTVAWAAATMADPHKVAAALKVDYVMEGGVRRSGELIELEIRLTNQATGRLIWREAYRSPLGEALLMQRELASAVSQALWIAATPRELVSAARPVQPKAAELYLVARGGYTYDTTRKDLPGLIEQLDEVVRLDPGFGAAWAFLGRLHARLAESIDGTGESYRVHMPLARAAVTRAGSLDPNLTAAAEAWAYIAQYEGDYDAMREAAERAYRLSPSDPAAAHRLAHAYEFLQRWDEAIALVEGWTRREPQALEWWWDLGDFLTANGRYAEGWAAYERQLALDERRARRHLWRNRMCETGDLLQGETKASMLELDESSQAARMLDEPTLALERAARLYQARIANGSELRHLAGAGYEYAVGLHHAGRATEARGVLLPIARTYADALPDHISPPRRPLHFALAARLLHRAGEPEVEVRRMLELAQGSLRDGDYSPYAQEARRQLAASIAVSRIDDAWAMAVLTDSLQHPANTVFYTCPWAVWRNPEFRVLRDHEPFRALMREHGVDTEKGIEDYAAANAAP